MFGLLFSWNLELFELYETIVNTIEAPPILYSSPSTCFYIYKCSTAILYLLLLLCARIPCLRDSVLNRKLAAI